jgi:RHS repeat-associated protein
MSGYGFTSGIGFQPVVQTSSGIGFQPVVQNRTHGPTHELLTAGGQSVNTDVKGNITLLPTALSSLASTALGMSWDFDNKLKSVDVGNNSSTDVEYKYDALGRRVARVGSSGSFVYVQSDQQTIADYGVRDAPSSPLYRYVYASYIDEPVVRKGAGTGGTIHYYHRNQQYSITSITTSAGAIAERYAYSAYGEPTICDGSGSVIASSAISNRYSYTGREWDATVGLYHFRARWMSPKTGRFPSRDPIKYTDKEKNLYPFISRLLLTSVDPSGLDGFHIPPVLPLTWHLLLRPLQGSLSAACDDCICKPDCNPARCRDDARRISDAIQNTFQNNYGNGNWTWNAGRWEWNPFSACFGGYFCYEWSWGLLGAFQSVDSPCFSGRVRDTQGTWTINAAAIHSWLEIKNECGGHGNVVYVDDGFFNGRLVNDAPPIPWWGGPRTIPFRHPAGGHGGGCVPVPPYDPEGNPVPIDGCDWTNR